MMESGGNRNKHDVLDNATDGIANSRVASQVTGTAGAILPGPIGNSLEFVGSAFSVSADGADLASHLDFLSERAGVSSSALLMKSRALQFDKREFDDGSKLGTRLGKTGIGIGGATLGALAGGAILPGFGIGLGALAGGLAAGQGASVVAEHVIHEREKSNTDLCCELCHKQDAAAHGSGSGITAQDILEIVAAKSSVSEVHFIQTQLARGNRNGFGLDHVVERYMAPVLPDEYYLEMRETSAECLARLCNEGKIDVMQLFLDEQHMQSIPNREFVAMQRQQSTPLDDRSVAMMSYDPSFDGDPRAPVLPAGLPTGSGGGMRRNT